MDITTLEKANKLNKKIKEFSEALNCFEWQPEENAKAISTNPRIIIEFDCDGREQLPLPMNLSDELVKFLKNEIIKGRDIAVAEFNAL
ncbi:hypothetical protein [Flavobacterium sp. HNIBRBA15423]|uniref:hypothetical protein n=1 Tax=Flavobacterium sp. HNIBRBA15423 TaxID=3458683 RepID=UPI0040446B14